MDGVNVRHVGQLDQVGLGRQADDFCHHGSVQLGIGDYAAHDVHQPLIQVQRATGPMNIDQPLQHIYRQTLGRLPAIEPVRVVLGQEHAIIPAVGIAQLDRRREAAQQRRQRASRYILEYQRLLGFGDGHNSLGTQRLAIELQRHLLAVTVQQRHSHRNHLRQLVGLAGRWRADLIEVQAVFAARRVILAGDAQARGTGLAVPALELAEIGAVGVFQRLDEVIAGHRLTIMPLKIQVGALAKALLAQQRVQHAHHLCALLVDGQGVEVGDLDKGIRAHRVCHGAGVFGKLVGTQEGDILNALDRARVHVSGELGIAEDGKAFFQRQLEPVTAGNPVTGPVVEIFVRDHRLDPLEGHVGRSVLMREHAAGVEDIEALVLHRAHVEIIDRNDHEDIQIVLTAIDLFIPTHGALEAVHGVVALGAVFRLDVNAQVNLAPAHGGEAVLQQAQITSDQGEQVGRFGERVFPADPVATTFVLAGGNRVAV